MLSNITFSQNIQSVRVTLRVMSSSVPSGSDVYVAGNTRDLGEWQAGAVKLTKISAEVWEKSFTAEAGERLEFKFTLGEWGNEALKSDGSVPPNNVLIVSADTTAEYTIVKWNNGQRHNEGKITGNVRYHEKLDWPGINARDVIVWLPPDYGLDAGVRYPVLYMHDGQNIIDPATSSFGVDWGADETADRLIRAGKMKSIIIVGIYNTRNRTAEYSYTDNGYAYMKFITDKLKPLIDSTYLTLPDRNNTATMGSSMGGLISLMLAWEHPEVFSMAGCLSPAFKIQQLNYNKFLKKYDGPDKDIKLYIDNGGVGLEAELQPGIEDAISILKEKGFSEGKNLLVYFDKSAEHNERAWASRLWMPMLFMFGK